PLFWIHLNVDYPFNLTGILYFPKIKERYEIQKDKIQLYSNQVFVTDEVKDIVPEFLMLLHGVIDSLDIPLNVSRSYLQVDSNVKKINDHINKKETTALQKKKDGKIVMLYTTDPVQQDSYIQAADKKGYKVIKLETIVDAAFINNMEMKWTDIQFVRVDADITENLIDKGENA